MRGRRHRCLIKKDKGFVRLRKYTVLKRIPKKKITPMGILIKTDEVLILRLLYSERDIPEEFTEVPLPVG